MINELNCAHPEKLNVLQQDKMYKYLLTSLLALTVFTASAQQLIGLTTNNYVAVNQLQLNPAYVNNARFAPEFSLFSLSMLESNNAYTVSSQWVMGGANTDFRKGHEYLEVDNTKNKKLFVNLDITGPAFSFTYKKQYQFGLYTRFRTIVSAGGISDRAFRIYNSDSTNAEYYHHTLEFNKTGATAQGFGEIGITLGKMLHDDAMYKVSGGITIKYLMGFAAMNVYTKKLNYQRSGDSIFYATGDLNAMFTYNTTPGETGDLAQRAGKGGLGLDIGVQYHYFPDDDPNKEIPYRLSIAAAITDIGSVGYVADAGSGKYQVNAGKTFIHNYEMTDADGNDIAYYLNRQTGDKVVSGTKSEKFRIGLPTAFRLNSDFNLGDGFYVSANTLLNLRGKSATTYGASYASYINVTPRLDIYRSFKIATPFTLMRYKDLTMGAIVYLGPLYVGSTSFLSSMIFTKHFKNIDLYAGMAMRFVKHERDYSRTYDNAYDDPNKGLRRFIPGFLRGEKSIICPR